MSGAAFGMCPRSVITDRKLGNAAVRLYALLTTYANADGECWPSQTTLANDLGLTSRRMVVRLMADLQAAGHVQSSFRKDEFGRRSGCVYRLCEMAKPSPAGGTTGTYRGGTTGTHGGVPEVPELRVPVVPGGGVPEVPIGGVLQVPIEHTKEHTTEQTRASPQVLVEDQAPKAGKPAPDYAFEGVVIKLTHRDYDRWKAGFPDVDLPPYLTARDAWLSEQTPADRKNWFVSTATDLRNFQKREAIEKGNRPPAGTQARASPPVDPKLAFRIAESKARNDAISSAEAAGLNPLDDKYDRHVGALMMEWYNNEQRRSA